MDGFLMKTVVMRFLLLLVFIPSVTLSSTALARTALPEFSDLIEDKSPAVVKITTVATVSGGPRVPQQEVPELFRRFFDPRQMPERNVGGMGSGFIISSDGYVLTNNHVVEQADEITVRLQDRQTFEAEVIGTDPSSDLALLKVDARGLPFLEFAKDDDLRVGEWVFAIGSPFGMDFSASQGIVSAIGRSIPDQSNRTYVPFIQTDVAINPGNSGGPLFNMDGEVVGINSQIFTRSGGYMGLSFAIPASVAKSVVAQLKDKGRVDRGWLGVAISNVSQDLAEAFGLREARGALIEQADPEGPAARYGLKPGDVIVEFNGVEIETSDELPPVVGSTAPDSTVPVVVMREGKQKTVKVKVGTLDQPDTPVAAIPDPGAGISHDRLGLSVEEAGDSLKDSIGINGGVMVAEVSQNSPAAKAGLRRGDVIVQLGFEEVTDEKSYRRIVEKLPTGSLLPIRFFRRGQPAFRTIIIGEK